MTDHHAEGDRRRRRRCTKRDRNKPVARDERTQLALYRPTQSVPSWRIAFPHPVTGTRVMRRFPLEAMARDAFTETLAWLSAAPARPRPARVTLPATPRMPDLAAEARVVWIAEGVSAGYLRRRESIWRLWIEPVCALVTVDAFMADPRFARDVLARARDAGLAPATLQDVGAVLRFLVSVAHERRWASPARNPMAGVRWAARNTRRQGPTYVPMNVRPTSAMVEDLIDAFDTIGGKVGVAGLGLLPAVGGFGGLRFGEQTAVMPFQWDAPALSLDVCQAWREVRTVGMQLHSPKNGTARPVLLPASVAARVDDRVALSPAVAGALVVPRRDDEPATPWTEGSFRRVFLAAVRMTGWPVDGHGKPTIPYRNLRHHAATWMHDVAGMDWPEVSRQLGHHSVQFTMARYVLMAEGALDRAQRRMREL